MGSILVWGTIPVLLKDLTAVVDGWTANGFRYPLAAVLYWPFLWTAYQNKTLDRRLWKAALIPALLTGLGQVFWGLAPYYLTASVIGFYVRLSLLWSLLGAMILFSDERRLILRPRFLVGLLLTAIGFYALSGPPEQLVSVTEKQGIVITVCCSLFFGLYAVAVRHFLSGFHPLTGFGAVCQYVAAGLLIAMLVRGEPASLGTLAVADWVKLVVSSLFGIAVGHFLLYTAVRGIGAALTSAGHSVTPFVTALIAAVFLSEQLSSREWAGGVGMVLGAVVLLSTQFQKTLEADASEPIELPDETTQLCTAQADRK